MTTQSTERGTFWRFMLAMLLTFALMIGTAGLLWSLTTTRRGGPRSRWRVLLQRIS